MNTKHRLYGLLPCLMLLLCSVLFTGQAAAYDSSNLTIPSCAKAITYGTSGEGRSLMAYQFGSGKNVMVLGYEIHGYEDNYNKDGGALVYAAGQMMNLLANNQALLDDYDWTVYVLPSMNPDGLISGYTKDGPGRLTTTYLTSSGSLSSARGIDMNRSFPTGWTSYTSARNYNGPAPLACRESAALAKFVQDVKGSGVNMCFDVHGWYSQIITSNGWDNVLYNTLKSAFPNNSYASCRNGSGYFTAYTTTLGYISCLFEYPSNVYSLQGFQSSGYCEKFNNCILTIAKSYSTYNPKAYTVTARSSGGGTYASGSLVTLTANASSGHTLVGWYDRNGTLLSTNRSYTFTVSADVTITAQFGSAITLKASRSGSVTGEGTYPDGTKVTLSAQPDDGHEFQGWYSLGGTLLSESPSYTITANGANTIVGMFQGDYFYDISSHDWFLDNVIESAQRGMVAGTSDITFSPYQDLTRGQVVAILARMEQADTASAPTAPFTDVKPSEYYATAINWAYANGVIAGISDTQFAPDASITRQELIAILIRYLTKVRGLTLDSEELTFTDAAQIESYAREPIQKAMSIGLIYGYPDGSFQPNNQLPRCEGVSFLLRLARYLETLPAEPENPEPSEEPEVTPSVSPEPTPSPEPSESPAPSTTPTPEVSPNPSEAPAEPTVSPTPSPEPSPTPSASVSAEPDLAPEPSH